MRGSTVGDHRAPDNRGISGRGGALRHRAVTGRFPRTTSCCRWACDCRCDSDRYLAGDLSEQAVSLGLLLTWQVLLGIAIPIHIRFRGESVRTVLRLEQYYQKQLYEYVP